MQLRELLELIGRSESSDWERLTGFGSFTLLPEPPGAYEEHSSAHGHDARAAYRPDVSIGLAWGGTENRDFQEDWAKTNPDPKAFSEFVDVLYNGMPVKRLIRVVVDGGRAGLPLPHRASDQSLYITKWEYDFFALIQELGGGLYDYDRYVRQSGFAIHEIPPGIDAED